MKVSDLPIYSNLFEIKFIDLDINVLKFKIDHFKKELIFNICYNDNFKYSDLINYKDVINFTLFDSKYNSREKITFHGIKCNTVLSEALSGNVFDYSIGNKMVILKDVKFTYSNSISFD